MSEPRFPTTDQIERRTDQIIEGLGYPYLPRFPGIVFRRLTLAEKGEVSRAFSAFKKADMAAGGRFSEPFLPTELRRRCLEVGLNYDELMAKGEEFQKRIFDQAPADLQDVAPRLSDEEIALLGPEEKSAYYEGIRRRGLEIKEYLENLFTPEEKIIRGQIEQVKQLQTQLTGETYEHHARMHQVLQEILRGARREDDLSKPYFASLDALYDLDDTDHSAWLLLVAKWGEFKHGRWPSFTRPSSSTPTPGAG